MNMVANSEKKARIKEYIDNPHDNAAEEFDKLLDTILLKEKLKEKLEEIIKKDPYYFDSYIYLAQLYSDEYQFALAHDTLKRGYELAVRKIANHKGEFPKRLEWTRSENRHIIRIINKWAFHLWVEGESEMALTIFRKLLRSNPADNIGARYSILAILMNVDLEFDDNLVSVLPESIEGRLIDKWFAENAPAYPEDFEWWFQWHKGFEEENMI
jgi:tetratricopeptide (TPR) repeat protein